MGARAKPSPFNERPVLLEEPMSGYLAVGRWGRGSEMQWEDFGGFVGEGEEQYESTIDLDISLLLKPKVT